MEEILSFEDIRIPQVDQVGPRLVEGHVHFSFFHLGRHRLGQERSYYAAYVRAVSSRMGWGKNSHVTVLLQLHHTWCVCVCVRMYLLLRHAWGEVGMGWGKNIHVTLHMYLLPRHAWGGVGVGWGKNIHVTLRMYVLPRQAWGGYGGGVGQKRSSYAAYVRAATSRMGWGWVGWGQNVSCYAACCYMVGLGWGGVGK